MADKQRPHYLRLVPEAPVEAPSQAPAEIQSGTPSQPVAAAQASAPAAEPSASRPQLEALMQAQREHVLAGTADLRIAREAAAAEHDALLQAQGFKTALDGANAIEKARKAGELPETLQQLKAAQERVQSASGALRARETELEKAFSHSEQAAALRTNAAKEMERRAAGTRLPKREPGKWAQSLENVSHNLFSKERGGGQLAMNWFFTGIGGLMMWDGVKLLTAKPPEVLVQDEQGNVKAEKGKKPFSNIAWGIGMLGMGAMNLYWGALSEQRGRGMF